MERNKINTNYHHLAKQLLQGCHWKSCNCLVWCNYPDWPPDQDQLLQTHDRWWWWGWCAQANLLLQACPAGAQPLYQGLQSWLWPEVNQGQSHVQFHQVLGNRLAQDWQGRVQWTSQLFHRCVFRSSCQQCTAHDEWEQLLWWGLRNQSTAYNPTCRSSSAADLSPRSALPQRQTTEMMLPVTCCLSRMFLSEQGRTSRCRRSREFLRTIRWPEWNGWAMCWWWRHSSIHIVHARPCGRCDQSSECSCERGNPTWIHQKTRWSVWDFLLAHPRHAHEPKEQKHAAQTTGYFGLPCCSSGTPLKRIVWIERDNGSSMSVWGDRTSKKSPTAARTALCYVVMGAGSRVPRPIKTKRTR